MFVVQPQVIVKVSTEQPRSETNMEQSRGLDLQDGDTIGGTTYRTIEAVVFTESLEKSE